MELSQYGELFLAESREHVSSMNHLLLRLEADPRSRETIEGLFRAVHTIKGMSATMGYRAVADLAHELENLLDELRERRRAATPEIVDLLFAATDGLEVAIEHAVSEREQTYDPAPLIVRLRGLGASSPAAAIAVGRIANVGRAEAARGVRVEVVVDAAAPLPGVRAFLLLRRARELGSVSAVEPAEEAHQAEGFDGAFAFDYEGALAPASLERELVAVGEIASVAVRAPGAEPAALATEGATAGPRGRQVRVDPTRLDALMNQVGELVILRDRLRTLTREVEGADLGEVVDQTSRLIDELQGEIMRVRLVPVAQVFDRFPRLVRDAARVLGKRVDFQVEGETIEFDRSLLDEMGDPIVHLLRNSVDHGVETPAERRGAGKPEVATVRLIAARERSRAVIRVTDDGRGVQRDRVLARAVAAGLVPAESAATLADEEVFRLLTHPGFSTAAEVTDVSGRGVGLDVVANRVRAVGGTLEIASTPGQGTSFTLRLPLTLAIVQALLVRVGGERYAIPLAHVAETTEIDDAEIRGLGERRVMLLRDEVVPVFGLRELLRYEARAGAGLASLVVLEFGEHLVGLEVDALLGQQEIVVKPFDAAADTLRVFSGATILSDGRPALILDVGSVPALAERGAAACAV